MFIFSFLIKNKKKLKGLMKVHLTSLIKSINQKENKNFDCYLADPIFALPNNEQVV